MKPLEWLLSIAEASFHIDAHQIIQRYENLKEEFEEYELKTTQEITLLKKQNKKLKSEKDEAMANLRKLND